MEFEKAKKAVRRLLQQYAGDDVLWAATVVAAALNDLSAESGLAFRVGRLPLIYDEAEQKS